MTSSRGKLISFLKGYDRFSKPVSLTYKKKKGFSTAIGGACTIFVLLVLLLIATNALYNAFILYDYASSSVENMHEAPATYSIAERQFYILNNIVADPPTGTDDPIEVS